MRKIRCDRSKIKTSEIRYRFYVFDTETTSLSPMPENFVFGVIYGYNSVVVIRTVDQFKREFRKPKYKGKTIFAHNAEFDLMTIYGNIYQNLDTAAIFNGGFISAKSGDVTFADSMNLFAHMSVKRIGEMIGMKKIDNVKVREEGLTKENMTQDDIEYCIQDCRIVFKALQAMFESIGAVRTTLPSLVMFDYRHNYLGSDLWVSDHNEAFYESYYGGRCEAFFIGRCDAKVYDINSMYPWAMRNVIFPDVSHLKRVDKPSIKLLVQLMGYFEGMAKVRVRHKDAFFGYLPCKMKMKHSEKLVFPVGEFETTVNFNELRFALSTGKVMLISCEYLVYGRRVKSPFVQYIDDLYREKEQAKDMLNRTIFKLRMNALYGKFGQKTKYQTVYYPEVPIDLIRQYDQDKKWYEVKPFNRKRPDCFIITENDNPVTSFYSVPAYASYITSEARTLLLKALLQNESGGVVYCDTDSIFICGDFLGTTSNRLGDWKLEGKKVIEVRGLKNYTYENDKGEQVEVIKGVAKNSVKVQVNGRTEYHIKKYNKTLQSLRQNKKAGAAYTMIKEIRSPYDKRIVLKDGTTKPIKL